MLSNLAYNTHTRYKITGDPEDLRLSISRGEEAVAAYNIGDPDRANALGNLPVFLTSRYQLVT
jgi:hypothetical protein